MEYFKSKKLLVALIYFALELSVGAKLVEIPAASMDGVRTVMLAYLGGQSFVDSILSWKGKK